MMKSVLEISAQIIIAATSIYALVTSIKSLLVSRRAFEEENRPYITFSIESEVEKAGIFFFYIRNTGTRGANNVIICINPTPKSYFFASHPEHKDIGKFKFAFLAPNQTIRTFFDMNLHRYPQNGPKPDAEVFNISITYSYNGQNFQDEYKCDTSYLRHINNEVSTPNDPKRLVEIIHKDLESIVKAIKRENDNHEKNR